MSVVSKLRQLLGRVGSVTGASTDAPTVAWTPSLRFEDQIAASGMTIDDWLERRRQRGAMYSDLSQQTLDALRSRYPDRVAQTIAAANRICAHEFDLLGSGPVTIFDRTRRARDGYKPIDWNVDPILGLKFPTGFPHKAWNPSMRPGLADIKWPWEIGRCQHWVTLGQAFRFTGDERYAREIVRQLEDFVAVNPAGRGLQFVCTMDVAIRAYNWIIAFELIRTSASFDRAAMLLAYRSLFDIGQFIIENLENTYEVTSNHFLSNIVGLYGVAVCFESLPAGKEWIEKSRDWIEQEMRVQVLEDGADYESSVPYHRLVAELFLGAARLAAITGAPFSSQYLDRLRLMIVFHEAVLRPDGMMPQFGDADDGRLHIFSDYGTWQPADGRHLLGPGGAFFGLDDFVAAGGDYAGWEAAWWGFELPHTTQTPAALPDRAQLFPAAGIAVMRRSQQYLAITNGRVGTSGFGNHKHNDLLSFEYHDRGQPLIVDPGSYAYTSQPDERNRFRATAYHNTVVIDDAEQNELRLDYLFRMFETSRTEHVGFEPTPTGVEYAGRHTGYERLAEPVSHQRRFDLRGDVLSIVDELDGSGRHDAQWFFHFAPGVKATIESPGRVVCESPSGRWILAGPSALTLRIESGWYSPSYGVRNQAWVAIYSASSTPVPFTATFTLAAYEKQT